MDDDDDDFFSQVEEEVDEMGYSLNALDSSLPEYSFSRLKFLHIDGLDTYMHTFIPTTYDIPLCLPTDLHNIC